MIHMKKMKKTVCLVILINFIILESRGNFLETADGKVLLLKNYQTVTIPCKPANVSEYECQWLRNNQPVVIGRGIWKDKYEWATDPRNTSDCSINFINSSVTYHEGIWECIATDLHTEHEVLRSKKMKFLIIEMPKNLSVDISEEGILDTQKMFSSLTMLTMKTGSLLRINCSACCSKPKGEIIWKPISPKGGKLQKPIANIKKNEILQNDSSWFLESSLEVQITSNENRWQFYCFHAIKGAPVIHRSDTVALNVVYPPISTNDTANVAFPKYSVAFLECPLTSNPSPVYRWSKENGESGEFVPLEDSYDRILQLYFIQEEQLGVYKCTATNSFGGEEKTGEALIRLNFGQRSENGRSKGNKNKRKQGNGEPRKVKKT